MKKRYTILWLFLSLLSFHAYAQPTFKVGDKVELFVAGDAQHGIVVGGLEDSGYGYKTYQVHLDGEKYCSEHRTDSRYNSEYVLERFQPEAEATFKVGDLVEVRRYDKKVYTGRVVGVDENRYDVKYKRDGYETSDWFNKYNVRASAKAQPATARTTTGTTKTGGTVAITKPTPNTGSSPASKAPAASGKINVGDRVMYADLGYLAGKNYGKVVSYDSEKQQYTIRDEKDASWKYTYACYNVLLPDQKIDNSFYIGKWEVHIIGATSTFAKNGDVYRRFSGGMKLPPLEVKADGTYVWVTDKNKIIKGKWKARDGVPGIILLKAVDGLDYTLYEKTEAFATTSATRDEIGIHHVPSSTGYYHAYRIGPNKSCVLKGRTFKK